MSSLRQELEDLIVVFCEAHGIDPHDPYDVNLHKREIWNALEESGKLLPGMSFEAFDSSISEEAMRVQVRKAFAGFGFKI